MIRRPLVLLVTALVMATVISSGCTLNRGSNSDPVVVPATAIPTFVATPRLAATALPTPTATPVTNLGRAQAEYLVWTQIATCTEEIARATGTDVETSFSSTYNQESSVWAVEASSQILRLRLGAWEVADATGLVAPVDQVSKTIADPNIVCSQPGALLAEQLTPPLLATVTPTPRPPPDPTATPTPTATPLPTATLVPTPTPAPSSTPALPPTPTPTPAPPAGTAEQARLRVWVAARSCFISVPPLDAFTAYQDQPQRWIVEGRDEIFISGDRTRTVTYGLWFVAVETGEITPYDRLAQRIASDKSCFKEP